MPQRSVALLLGDVEDAGQAILSAIDGHSFDQYRATRTLRSSVEREFIIVGEALASALRLDETLVLRISNARDVIAFRNVLVHGYSVIRDDAVWGFIHSELPRLLAEVRALLPSG